MSTIKVTNVQNPSAASAAITLDTNGQATLNGLAYPTSGSLSGRNRIINGDMRIDQRNAGAAVTVNTGSDFYSVDRFPCSAQGGGVFTAQRSTTAPTGFSNSLLATVTTADASIASTDYYGIQHKVEGFNTADFGSGTANAQVVTLSFWVRSSETGTYGISFGNNANNRWYPTSYAINAANTWEKKAITFTCDTTGTWDATNGTGLWIWFDLGAGSNLQGTANSWDGNTKLTVPGAKQLIATNGATFYITGVQLEAGSVATPFERRPIGTELALCQRYYYTHVRENNFSWGVGTYYASNLVATHIYFPVSMRSAPALDYKTGTNYYGAYSNGAFDAFDAMAIARAQPNGAGIDTSTGTSGTAGPGCVLATNNADSFIAFTAEL